MAKSLEELELAFQAGYSKVDKKSKRVFKNKTNSIAGSDFKLDWWQSVADICNFGINTISYTLRENIWSQK